LTVHIDSVKLTECSVTKKGYNLMTTTQALPTKHPLLDLESLTESKKIELYVSEHDPLKIISSLGKRDDFTKYIYGAALLVIDTDYETNTTSAREKYGYNSFSDLVRNHETFSGYSLQHWFNLKEAYVLISKHELTFKDIEENKIKYTRLLALKNKEFDTKEALLEALKAQPRPQLESDDFSTIGLPLNPQAPPSVQQTSSFTNNDDGYVYPVEDEKEATYSQEQGNMEVLPPAWDNVPKTEIDARTFKTHMNTADYLIFTEDLEALKSTLSSDLPHLFNPEANDSTLTNAVLCFVTKFAWDNMDIILKQYKKGRK
jgi:hypothetical protein